MDDFVQDCGKLPDVPEDMTMMDFIEKPVSQHLGSNENAQAVAAEFEKEISNESEAM